MFHDDPKLDGEKHCECCVYGQKQPDPFDPGSSNARFNKRPWHSTFAKLLKIAFFIGATALLCCLVIYVLLQFSGSENPHLTIGPQTTALARRGPSDVSIYERSELRWWLGFTWRSVALGVAIASLALTCVGVVTGAGCVAGVIGTGMLLADLSFNLGRKYPGEVRRSTEHIGRHRLGPGYIRRRDESEDDVGPEYFQNFKPRSLGWYYEVGSELIHHGYITENSTWNGHLLPKDASAWPVFQFNDPSGNAVHVVTIPDGGSVRSRMWYANVHLDTDEVDKRQYGGYNSEYFKSGGIDFNECQADRRTPLEKKDHTNISKAVHCYMKGNGEKHAAYVQTYDASTRESIASTALAIVKRDGSSAAGHLSKCPRGVQGRSPCNARYIS